MRRGEALLRPFIFGTTKILAEFLRKGFVFKENSPKEERGNPNLEASL